MELLKIKKAIPIPVVYGSNQYMKPKKEEKPKRAYHRRANIERVVMGYTIRKGFIAEKPTGLRPRSWEPLFKALAVGDCFEFPKKELVAFRSAASKYSKRHAPKIYVVQKNGTKFLLGRVK